MSIINLSAGSQKDTLVAAPTPDRLKKGQRVAIITGNNVEDLEFFYPYYRLNEAGYDVDVFTLDGEKFKGKTGYEFKSTSKLANAQPGNYALLYLPGGKAPAELRKHDEVINFVKQFAQSGKPIAAICHGPQILITADLVRGKQIACWPEVQEELEEAGGKFVNEALVVDGQFITGRMPGDLPRHLAGVMDALEGKLDLREARGERKSA
jgi:protease I